MGPARLLGRRLPRSARPLRAHGAAEHFAVGDDRVGGPVPFRGGVAQQRAERWRYSQWVEAERGEVLFDEQADPHELTNLAADPKYAAQLAEMKALLAK